MVIIGIDPDATAHGVAVYENGKLDRLAMMETLQVAQMAKNAGAICSIENVQANGFIYARNNHASKAAQSKIAMQVGRNQQAQVELCRLLDAFSVPFQLVKPCKSNWARDEQTFKRYTGWEGRSNVDTRSAAYFGFLLARK